MPGAWLVALGLAQDVEIEAWQMKHWTEPNGQQVTDLSGQVMLRTRNLEVRADRVMAFKRPDSTFRGRFDEVYAEGFVTVKSETGLAQSDRVFIDLTRDRAIAVEFVFRGTSKDPPTPFQVRAREVVQLSRHEYVADRVTVSSCEFATPHFEVRFKRAWVTIAPTRETRPGEFIPAGSEIGVRGEHISAWFYDVPILYFPGFTYYLGMEYLIRRITVSQSDRFGWQLYTDWGFSLYEKDEEGIRRRWADLAWSIDWREERGWAAGFQPKWKHATGYGYLDSYFIYDHGPNKESAFDRQFLPLIRRERGRAKLFDRIRLWEDFRLDVEGSYVSDRNFLPEFFRKEFLTDKEQETTVYVRWMRDNAGAVAQGRYRLNEFQSQLEMLPRVEHYLWGEPVRFLGDRVRYSQNTQAANLRFRPDEALPPGVFQTWRGDTQHELFLPLDFDLVQINGFVLGRVTGWEHNVERHADDRLALSGGFDGSLSAWGLHSFRAEWLGMRDLRHILVVRASYATNVLVTRSPSHFAGLDRRDALDEFEEISLELRQRFQTKLENGSIQEFLKLTAEIEYYPQHTRDAAAPNINSHLYPFNWLSAVPVAATPLDARRFSNLWYTASFTPAWIFTIAVSGEVDIVEGAENYRTAGVGFTPIEGVSLGASHAYVKHSSNSYFGTLVLEVAPHWTIKGSAGYDFRQKQVQYTQIDLVRRLHDLTVTGRFTYDTGEHDVRFLLLVEPKILK
jgi:hypothetical protein